MMFFIVLVWRSFLPSFVKVDELLLADEVITICICFLEKLPYVLLLGQYFYILILTVSFTHFSVHSQDVCLVQETIFVSIVLEENQFDWSQHLLFCVCSVEFVFAHEVGSMWFESLLSVGATSHLVLLRSILNIFFWIGISDIKS